MLQTSPLGLPLGALKPRVETHPDYVTSYGAESADLMARAGRPLDAWQQDSVTLMLAIRDDGKWACFECCEWVCRQQGKGAILEARALTGFLLLGEELIMWSAHEYKTAMEAFRRVKALIKALGAMVGDNENLWLVDGIGLDEETGELRETQFVVKINNTNGEEGFERLDTGARIKFIARSKGSGRGFSGDLNIIDEAFAYTPEQHSALLYTVSARPNPQFIYASSPPLTGDTGEIMFALRRRGDPTSPRRDEDGPWEQDPSLGYRDWGLAGDLDHLDGVDLDDMGLAAASNPALGVKRVNGSGLTHETIVRERRATRADPAGFARERLGIWPRYTGGDDVPQWQVIPEAAWEAARDPRSQLEGRPAVGVYVPPDRSYTAIGVAGARVGGGRHVEVAGDGETVDYRPGTAWVVSRLKELDEHEPSVLVIDDKALADEAEKAGLIVHRATLADVVTGCQLLYDGIAGPDVAGRDVRHIGQEALADAARGAVKRDVGGSWAWARRDVSVETATLGAVSLALFGHCTPRVHRVERHPGAAFVATAPQRAHRPTGGPGPVDEAGDINLQRLREQLARDLAGR